MAINLKQETLARLLAAGLVLGAVVVPIAIRLGSGPIEIRARNAENGGWSPDALQAQVGIPLHLRLTSDDVVHGFGVGQMDFDFVDIEPGKWTDLALTFDKPGTYTYYCTRWCGVNHWRMRGIIDVGDPSDSSDTVTEPLYLTLGLDIDAPHPSPVLPGKKPSAIPGAEWMASGTGTKNYLAPDYYPSHSPYKLFKDLERSGLTESQRWDLVAYVWKSNATPEGLADGKKLFNANCAACHGENGAGDGVFAEDLASQGLNPGDEHGFKRPAALSDPESILGASPALLQGKILRGGMGTGMPMWGVIFTHEQIWNIISFLYSLQFQY